MTIREYRRMSRTYRNGLKREYKLRYTDEYSYNLRIKGLLIAGIAFAIIALMYAFKYNFNIGMLLFGVFVIYCIFVSFLLYQSHKHFESFLNNLSRRKRQSK